MISYFPIDPDSIFMTELPCTAAETSELEKWVNFKPNTSVKEGISNFIDWYKNFYVNL